MPSATQTGRPMAVTTPLGADVLLLTGFSGQETLSRLFNFYLDLVADSQQTIAFDQLLGQSVTVRVSLQGSTRYFNGLCYRFTQGESDKQVTAYRMELVPKLWLLSKRAQSRIFQQISVPDILQEVLKEVNPEFELQGTFSKRDYCVQYRETDFNFASRLMEEEGIYYYFRHADGSHTMVVANTPAGHADVPEQNPATYKNLEGGEKGAFIHDWGKVQELRAGKYTLWDYCFEKPDSHFEASEEILPEVQVGQASHPLEVGNNGQLEIYDYPGEYAQRFDGVDPGGGDRPSDISNIFTDNQRTASIRMEEEAAAGIVVQGAGNCQQFSAGFKVAVKTLGSSIESASQAEGQYVLTSVLHTARQASIYRSGGGTGFSYHNTFTGIPSGLPYRPPRLTPKPVVHGTQTAVVVGPAGEEIFTDKYGRVKVQFPWDRKGKKDAGSSCWVRVGTLWAGKQWGVIHIPRIGQEVVVAFEEGDMDKPIIVGSIYNAEQMPPYKLPDNKTQSGLKTRSTLKGGAANFNELRFEDKKGSEEVHFHAEKDFNRVVENNDTLKVGSSQADDGSQTIEIWKDRTETVKTGDEKVTIEKGKRDVIVQSDDTHQIKQGNRSVKIDMGNDSLKISMGDRTTKIDLGKSATEAMQSIELKVGQSSITIDQMGVTIKGMMISVEGQVQTQVKGLMTQVNGDAMVKVQGGITMIN
jgi:type VI secretion system secreted protein VgrG